MQPQDCELCGVTEGTGWCATCCRVADVESDRRHRAMAKRTRPEGCGAGRKIGPHPTLDDYDNH